jgi:hypothetical protein
MNDAMADAVQFAAFKQRLKPFQQRYCGIAVRIERRLIIANRYPGSICHNETTTVGTPIQYASE